MAQVHETKEEDLKDSLLSQESVKAAEPPKTKPIDLENEQDHRFDALTKSHFWAYGVGHFVNDLAVSVWFNYLLFYLKRVIHTTSGASCLLAGQIADGLATPAVGLLSDKTNTRFGQRKPWYIAGLVLVCAGYIPLYSGFISDNQKMQYIFYILFGVIYNIGWAALQISHMSLVPALTCSRKRRDKLNNLRNSFTFAGNLTVLAMGLVIFSVMNNKLLQYKIISYAALAVGISASVFFIVRINEKHLTEVAIERQDYLKDLIEQRKLNEGKSIGSLSEFSAGSAGSDSQSGGQGVVKKIGGLKKKKQSKWDWFKMPKFYLFGLCYMGVRLYTNLFGTLLPFYLIDVVAMGTNDPNKISFNIALIPMLAYLASVLVSTRLNWFYSNIGRKKAIFLGTAICLVCLSAMAFLRPKHNWLMYVIAPFLGTLDDEVGVSQSLVLPTGINMISDVVGAKAKTGAFVFGIYSLVDKFSSGIAIFIIGESAAYTKDEGDVITESDVSFIRWTMVLVPGLSCLMSALIVLAYPIEEYGKKGKKKKRIAGLPKSRLEEQLVA